MTHEMRATLAAKHLSPGPVNDQIPCRTPRSSVTTRDAPEICLKENFFRVRAPLPHLGSSIALVFDSLIVLAGQLGLRMDHTSTWCRLRVPCYSPLARETKIILHDSLESTRQPRQPTRQPTLIHTAVTEIHTVDGSDEPISGGLRL
jgi:hypothetical protein